MASPVPRLSSHFPALDGLRGVAILLVLLHQLLLYEGTGPGRLVQYGLNAGWVGVQLFFVLSGFLITGILLDTRDSPGYYRNFFARRVLRIFPLYYAALVLFLVVLPALRLVPETFRENQAWLWLYLYNWMEPFQSNAALPHFWSLSVEEQFYLVWPLLMRRGSLRNLMGVCLAFAVASLGIRVAMLGAVSPEAIYMFTTSRMDALALGGAGAIAMRMPGWLPLLVAARRRLWIAALIVGLAGFVITHGYPRISPLGQTVGYSLLAITFALAILAAACSDVAGGAAWLVRSAALRTLGKYSYGMYVLHKPIHDLVGVPLLASLGIVAPTSLGLALAYIAVTTLVILGAAVLSYELFEKRFLALKRYFVAAPARS
jgi:peptidoglycan/LPS O-acetylase OafA/YrhL